MLFVIHVSSGKHLSCVEEGSWRKEIYVHITPYSVRMRENTDRKNLPIWTLFTQCILQAKKIRRKNLRYVFQNMVKANGNITAADASAVIAELESFSKKKGIKAFLYNISIPSRVKEKVGKYAYSNGTDAAINRSKSKFPQYNFSTYIYQQLET